MKKIILLACLLTTCNFLQESSSAQAAVSERALTNYFKVGNSITLKNSIVLDANTSSTDLGSLTNRRLTCKLAYRLIENPLKLSKGRELVISKVTEIESNYAGGGLISNTRTVTVSFKETRELFLQCQKDYQTFNIGSGTHYMSVRPDAIEMKEALTFYFDLPLLTEEDADDF